MMQELIAELGSVPVVTGLKGVRGGLGFGSHL